jgi:DNA-binding IclR family transcriptional regulator
MAIFSAPGKVDAAISLSMPLSRMSAEEARQQRIIQALRDAAGEISRKLKPSGPTSAKVG